MLDLCPIIDVHAHWLSGLFLVVCVGIRFHGVKFRTGRGSIVPVIYLFVSVWFYDAAVTAS